MAEALMLVLLGVLIMALASLALAPLLWARAARVTTERVRQDVHSAAFHEASDHVSKKYEGKIAAREGSLLTEIQQLEASRDKISSEASSRVSALEETRANLEREIANRDALLAESESQMQALAENVRNLGARADSLGREAADLGSRAEALSSEIAGLGESHHEIAQSLHPEAAPAASSVAAPVAYDETIATESPVEASAPTPEVSAYDPAQQSVSDDATYNQGSDQSADQAGPDQQPEQQPEQPVTASPAPKEPTLSDRIRALRDGVSA
jgi:predicted  nucleic acid-binding Zn-ribbon protein